MEKRKNVRQKNEPLGVSFFGNGNTFGVLREFDGAHKKVTFALNGDAILVRDSNDKTMFEVRLTLNDDGEGRVKIGDQKCEFWQLRMMALESIFFGGN